jgi:hypothetical protein
MNGAMLPLPHHAFMVWCSVKKEAQGQLLPFFSINESRECVLQRPLSAAAY